MKEADVQQQEPDQNEPIEIGKDDRIEEFAISSFQVMGYTHLSNNMVKIYKEFKYRKDRVQPGKLTPEGLACVATIAALVDGTLDLEGIPEEG